MTTWKQWARSVIAVLFAVAMTVAAPVGAMAATTADTTANITFEEGVIELVQAPTLTFTNTQLTGGSYLGITLASANKTIKVSDLRAAKNGWELTASLANFESASSVANSLGASNIVVTGAQATGGNPNIAENEKATCPATISLTCAASPVDVTVMSAASGAGFGIWESEWTNSNTVLNVAAGVQPTPEQHTADMHWTLTEGP